MNKLKLRFVANAWANAAERAARSIGVQTTVVACAEALFWARVWVACKRNANTLLIERVAFKAHARARRAVREAVRELVAG